MAKTPSHMLALGTPAPAFKLPDFNGKYYSIDDFKDSAALLVMFICSHCPYVIHVREGLTAMVKEYQAKGAAVVGINSNDIENYPQDGPEHMSEDVEKYGYTFPFLLDETQETATIYKAACTPDFFLFDRERKLVYRGRMDGSRPENDLPTTGEDLRAAMDAVLENRPVPEEQIASLGCNIKWKPGNEPEY
ncbi:MAG: thioredoxin family protein [bacterium]|nr:thioredoxin family protein [bacterium]